MARRTGQHEDHLKYHGARNEVVSQPHNSRASYFHKLSPSNSKQIWKAVMYFKKTSSTIPVLTHNNITYNSDRGKANVLNSFFTSCFNNLLQPPITPEDTVSDNFTSVGLCDILCAEEEVIDMLQSLAI